MHLQTALLKLDFSCRLRKHSDLESQSYIGTFPFMFFTMLFRQHHHRYHYHHHHRHHQQHHDDQTQHHWRHHFIIGID